MFWFGILDLFLDWCGICVFRERILEYRVESQSLDHCSRLHDSSVSNSGFEQDAAHIIQVGTFAFSYFCIILTCFFRVGRETNTFCFDIQFTSQLRKMVPQIFDYML